MLFHTVNSIQEIKITKTFENHLVNTWFSVYTEPAEISLHFRGLSLKWCGILSFKFPLVSKTITNQAQWL